MAKIKVGNFNYSSTPGVGAQVARAAMQAGRRAELPALTEAQMAKMKPAEIARYNARRSKVNMSINRKTTRRANRAAKVDQSLELKKAELAHTTIRQGLAELAGVGAEGVGSAAISRASAAANAVQQNIDGGMVASQDDGDDRVTEDGPVAYSKKGRQED